jgi:integrase
MSTVKILPSGNFQLRVTSKLLGRPLYATFDTKEQAQSYGRHLDTLLAQGIVPSALLEGNPVVPGAWLVSRCIAEYIRNNSVPASDVKILDTIRPQLALASTSHLNYDWAEGWIRQMKRVQNLSPSTIRHRHGALARCFDWMMRKHPDIMAQNPLRLLKRGFATYTDDDNRLLAAAGKEGKCDIERDRRLDADEEQRILGVTSSRPDEKTFFVLALETAMRMRECYTLSVAQVHLAKKTIFLDRTKNGDSRQVPLSSTASALLRDYMADQAKPIEARLGLLFPFWGGDTSVAALDAATSDLSRVFSNIFTEAKIEGLHFHDLRHEATCRLYEKTNLSDVLIAKITGHRNLRMLQRYASLRGSDLALHLW